MLFHAEVLLSFSIMRQTTLPNSNLKRPFDLSAQRVGCGSD